MDCMLVGRNGMSGVGLPVCPFDELGALEVWPWRIAVGKTARGGVLDRDGEAVAGPASSSIESGSKPPGFELVGWVLGEIGKTPCSCPFELLLDCVPFEFELFFAKEERAPF